MIEYVKGDLFKNLPEKPFGILHVCNNKGGWGAGFVLPLAKHFPEAEIKYRSKDVDDLMLGTIQIVSIDNSYVFNMIAQDGYASKANPHPLSLQALGECLFQVFALAAANDGFDPPIQLIGPKFGAGLGGGDWRKIENVILNAFEPHTETLSPLKIFEID